MEGATHLTRNNQHFGNRNQSIRSSGPWHFCGAIFGPRNGFRVDSRHTGISSWVCASGGNSTHNNGLFARNQLDLNSKSVWASILLGVWEGVLSGGRVFFYKPPICRLTGCSSISHPRAALASFLRLAKGRLLSGGVRR